MAATATELEQRLVQLEKSFSARIARLEEQVSELTQQMRDAPGVQSAAWWKRIVGVFQDDQEFEGAMRLGRAYRESPGACRDFPGHPHCPL
jgi:hypothetical protein